MRAVISHDAGGAEVLSSFVHHNPEDTVFVLEGPAIRVFERKLGRLATLSMEDALSVSESVLCSTSWQSSLEYDAIARARELGRTSTAFLDHWTNYEERFVRNGIVQVPDRLCVGDEYAERLAASKFPGIARIRIENPYLLDLKRELESLRCAVSVDPHTTSVLYVAEPVREHGLIRYQDERHWGYVEEEALRYFLSHTSDVSNQIGSIRIRPHPSESFDKYDWAVEESTVPITRGGDRALLEEVVSADIIVGCESMALVVGLLAGKRVVSCIPPGGQQCSLPQREIEHLQALVELPRTENPK